MLDHQLDERFEGGLLRVPAQFRTGLRGIAPEVHHVRRTVEIGAYLHQDLAGGLVDAFLIGTLPYELQLDAGMVEGQLAELADAVLDTRRNDEILRFLLLQDKAARAEKRRRKTAEIDFYEKEQKNVVPFGACLIFTPLFTKEQGEAFAPETMFFYEEYLLKLRCDRLQYRILYSPEVWVEHESGHATRSALKKTRRQLKFQLEQTAGAASVYLRELTE